MLFYVPSGLSEAIISRNFFLFLSALAFTILSFRLSSLGNFDRINSKSSMASSYLPKIKFAEALL